MPKKSLESLTESMFYVLMAFCRWPMCGIDAAAFIAEKTGGSLAVGPATLYTILGKFEKEGYLKEIATDGRKRTYAITEKGLAAYDCEVARLRRCVAALRGGRARRPRDPRAGPPPSRGLRDGRCGRRVVPSGMGSVWGAVRRGGMRGRARCLRCVCAGPAAI